MRLIAEADYHLYQGHLKMTLPGFNRAHLCRRCRPGAASPHCMLLEESDDGLLDQARDVVLDLRARMMASYLPQEATEAELSQFVRVQGEPLFFEGTPVRALAYYPGPDAAEGDTPYVTFHEPGVLEGRIRSLSVTLYHELAHTLPYTPLGRPIADGDVFPGDTRDLSGHDLLDLAGACAVRMTATHSPTPPVGTMRETVRLASTQVDPDGSCTSADIIALRQLARNALAMQGLYLAEHCKGEFKTKGDPRNSACRVAGDRRILTGVQDFSCTPVQP